MIMTAQLEGKVALVTGTTLTPDGGFHLTL